MIVTIARDIRSNTDKSMIWLKKGTYPVVRILEHGRLLVDVSIDEKRTLTVIPQNRGVDLTMF